MPKCWIFAGRDDHLEVGLRLGLWGFEEPSRDVQERFREYWEAMSSGDFALLQRFKPERAIALVRLKDFYYDSKTLIWPKEHEQGRAIYVWRVRFDTLYSLGRELWDEKGIDSRVPSSRYIRRIGLGLVSFEEFSRILKTIEREWFTI